MDALSRALVEDKGLRVAFVDASESARELAARHLAGPIAGQALGHGLVAAALLSVHLKDADHAIQLQLMTDGPIGGVSAEVWGLDKLRGYTQHKILPLLDGRSDVDLDREVFGRQGSLSVIHSTSKDVIYRGVVQSTPPTVRAGLARYYRDSLQTPAAVEVVSSGDEEVERAVGIAVEKLPGGDTEAFVSVLELFNSGQVRRVLADGGALDEVGALLGFAGMRLLDTKELRFACRCSAPKVVGVLAALPRDELREIASGTEPQEVICHYCGETYRITPEEVAGLIDQLSQ